MSDSAQCFKNIQAGVVNDNVWKMERQSTEENTEHMKSSDAKASKRHLRQKRCWVIALHM